MNNDWKEVLKEELKKDYFLNLKEVLDEEYETKIIYPPRDEVFRAFELSSFENTKVVIIGQDPYHGESQAEGLSFSVKKGVKIPPSLRNIYKELSSDLSIEIPNHGSLISWARQGVLLLNAVLTVEKDKAASHRDLSWEVFTDEVIKKLNEEKENLVFILWGSFAKSKAKYINSEKHLILTSVHPSPLSAYNGFFGTKVFSKTNQYLKLKGLEEIDWEIK